MAIQWFPGHMNKARKDVAERLKDIDVVIEMLDARLPASSANPMLARMAKGKPRLMILNKQDLADAAATLQWLEWYRAKKNTQALGMDAGERAPAQKLVAACRELAPTRGGLEKPLRVLICGIPNVGKSTLINSMSSRKVAKTGNMPGVTKNEQRIILADDVELFDTPGMLWPKIEVEEGGYNLAASGAVGRNAMDEEEVALELLKYLLQHYAPELTARYKLDDIAGQQDWQVLEMIGRKRGAVQSGGKINVQKAAEIVLTDFRDGNIGRITLERPAEWLAWEKRAKELAAIRAAEREARQQERDSKKSGSR
ncbi:MULTISPECIES: ribosome biogenesis GTPase YlqF [Chromobacterium]|uniref:Ribosome biogenesis GTPase A n=3 Tax=Chromobacterium TaxID=535 RepID=A0ABS3GRY1_9NEIS|nr:MULTISPECIES: ribosome biogenesis GTPase YlqF [Chromobacterium]AXT45221.1 ribosome biogenesis GTPase YlqF [Chromobacterium rhizoryzae]MBK0416593.1 ribosome biogenesis GTPase YlqF [Chromobacterium haemolyticum]MBO0417796.1 ribosome biogenesis GTPase YlqF [Chromobacterium haemolyticum]MBO0500988.1 ribosome biogenesis GTPase YlqF [Chromobacterium haemolyticum]MDH0343837.1 ribosome biogenesis GTPase YlqF [Chromobacterium haemolyticum]